jgi:DNA-directed RNA polymerase specialized sigma24 family protein
LSRTDTAALRTRDELADAIRTLSDADWGRLRKVAAAYARGRPIEADDLLQESFRRTFEGGRSCPAHVTVVKFLAEAMRSIAHGEKEKGDKQPVLVAIANHSDSKAAVDPRDLGPDPEQIAVSRELTTAMQGGMLALFEDDSTAQIILEGIMEGMEGEELRELTELTTTAYQSKRRLIRRRIDNAFPEGCMP